MFWSLPVRMAGRQWWCRGGSVGRLADATDDDDVWSLSARYVKTSAAVSWWNKRGRTLVVLMAMFGVCRCGIPGRQRRCRGGSVGRHAGGTEDDVWSLSARHTRTAAAVSRWKSRSKRPPNLLYCKSASFRCGESLLHSPGHFSSCKCSVTEDVVCPRHNPCTAPCGT